VQRFAAVNILPLALILSAPLTGLVNGAEPRASAQWEESVRAARKEGAVSVYF